MAKRNAIYQSKYEAEAALIFLALMFIIILFSGCMRNLQPVLDPIVPEVMIKDTSVKEACACCVPQLVQQGNSNTIYSLDPK